MLNIVNFFRGYLEVRIEGPYPERFLNIASQNDVAFWKMSREDARTVSARVRILEYPKLKRLAADALCTVTIFGKRGAPFFAWRLRKRYVLLAGFVLCAILLYTMSLRVWEFDVSGNEAVGAEQILRELEALGVKPGIPAKDIDTDHLEAEMLLRIKDLSWLTINIRGSRASVEVRERVVPPEVLDKHKPCNVVAAKAGVITKLTPMNGKAQVNVGDTVTEGQLLVSGMIDTKTGSRLVHAMGEAEAQTWYTLSASMPSHVEQKTPTGQTKQRYSMQIAGGRINFYWNSSNPFDNCDKMIVKNQLTLPGGLALPVQWITTEYSESEVSMERFPREEAELILKEWLEEELLRQTGECEVRSRAFTFLEEDGMYRVTLVAECREAIARTAEIRTD